MTDDQRTELMTNLMRAVLKMSAHAQRAGTAMNRDSGLTNARWILIDQAAEEPDPLTLSEHARRLGISRQAIRRLTAEMEKDGLIALHPDPDDARVLRLTLTPAGRKLQLEALARGLEYNRDISEQVSARAIGQALRTITTLTAKMMEKEVEAD